MRGGKREGSGRKPLIDKKLLEEIKAKISSHGSDEIEFANNKGKIVKKSRVLLLLDKLFQLGYEENNVPAIKEYLDRVIHKAVQPIEGTGEDGEICIKLDR
jgi:hypothetical protein